MKNVIKLPIGCLLSLISLSPAYSQIKKDSSSTPSSTPKFEIGHCVSNNLLQFANSAFINKNSIFGEPLNITKTHVLFKYHFKPNHAFRILPYLESNRNTNNSFGKNISNDNTYLRRAFSYSKIGTRLGYEHETKLNNRFSLLAATDLNLSVFFTKSKTETTSNFETYSTTDKLRSTTVNIGITPSLGLKYNVTSNFSLQLYVESTLSASVFRYQKVEALGGSSQVSSNLKVTMPPVNETRQQFMFTADPSSNIKFFPRLYLNYHFGKRK